MQHRLELSVVASEDWSARATSARLAFDVAPNPFHALVLPESRRALTDGRLTLHVQPDWDYSPLTYEECGPGTPVEVRRYRGEPLAATVTRRWEIPAERPPYKGRKHPWPNPPDMTWTPLDVSLTLRPGEWRWLRMGITTTSVDDKWHAFEEGGVMRWHRAWTGKLIYTSRFVQDGAAHLLTDVQVSHEQRDAALARDTFLKIVEARCQTARRVLGAAIDAPERPGAEGAS